MPRASGAPARPRSKASDVAKATVLGVDVDAYMRLFVAYALELDGCTVQTAPDGGTLNDTLNDAVISINE